MWQWRNQGPGLSACQDEDDQRESGTPQSHWQKRQIGGLLTVKRIVTLSPGTPTLTTSRLTGST